MNELIREGMELAVAIALTVGGFVIGFLAGRGDKEGEIAKIEQEYLRRLMENELND